MDGLRWSTGDGPMVAVLVAASAAFVIAHYGFDTGLLAALRRRAGRDEESAQAEGVLLAKLLGGILLFVVGLVTGLAVGVAPGELGLGLPRIDRTLMTVAGGAALTLPIVILAARGAGHWEAYPEIRAARWSPKLVWRSAGAWAVYLLGYEFYFRGFLLFFLTARYGPWPALAITTALYVFAHLPKPAPETAGTVVMGFGFGAMALWSGSMWAPFLLHLLIANTSDITAARANPAVKWWVRG